MNDPYADSPAPSGLDGALADARARLRRALDAAAPHVAPRWGGLALGVLAYGARAYSLKGFHIVSYALAIYNLNLLLGFLTPQVRGRVCVWGGEGGREGWTEGSERAGGGGHVARIGAPPGLPPLPGAFPSPSHKRGEHARPT